VSGTFTPDQRALYQIVRDALAAAERNSRAGMPLRAAFDSAVSVSAAGLARLGLVESPGATFDPPWPADCDRAPRSCRQAILYTIHGITHGIGLEVHDPLQAYYDIGAFSVGDAFTIEPGLYVSLRQLEILPDTPRNRRFVVRVRPAVERYAGTGIRIEDNYVITDQGLERVTDVPRDIDDIEKLTRRGPPIP
jgi:Xaa-Pro aminopeptidase